MRSIPNKLEVNHMAVFRIEKMLSKRSNMERILLTAKAGGFLGCVHQCVSARLNPQAKGMSLPFISYVD